MVCYVDSGYRNDGSSNSNSSGYGSFIIYDDFDNKKELSRFKLPEASSNNEAEYLGLIKLLIYLDLYEYPEATIYMDSQLVVNQVNNKWKINYKNLYDLYHIVKSFNVKFELKWIPREQIVDQLGH